MYQDEETILPTHEDRQITATGFVDVNLESVKMFNSKEKK
jgi:hypothetical protein